MNRATHLTPNARSTVLALMATAAMLAIVLAVAMTAYAQGNQWGPAVTGFTVTAGDNAG